MIHRAIGLSAVLSGCSDAPPSDTEPFDIVVELSETMPTVVHVRWSTKALTNGVVVFGEPVRDRFTPATPLGTDHHVTLVGLPQATGIHLGVFSTSLAELSDPLFITTGTLPDAPETDVVVGKSDHYRHVLTTVLTETESRIVLLDYYGRVTWHYVDRSGLPVVRARLRSDGGGIIYAAASEAGLPNEESVLVKVNWDGIEVEVIPVPDLAYDFVEQDNGYTIVALAYEERDGVLGNKLLKRMGNGLVEQIWSAWDCFDPVVDVGDDPAQGWTGANALDADGDDWLVSLRNLNAIIRVDEATDACTWVFGGNANTFDIEADAPTFEHPIQFALGPGQLPWHQGENQLLVFDSQGPSFASRVVEYEIDQDDGSGSYIGEVASDPPRINSVLGDVQVADLEEFWVFVAWSAPAAIEMYGSSFSRVSGPSWRIDLVGEGVFGYMEAFEEPIPGFRL